MTAHQWHTYSLSKSRMCNNLHVPTQSSDFGELLISWAMKSQDSEMSPETQPNARVRPLKNTFETLGLANKGSLSLADQNALAPVRKAKTGTKFQRHHWSVHPPLPSKCNVACMTDVLSLIGDAGHASNDDCIRRGHAWRCKVPLHIEAIMKGMDCIRCKEEAKRLEAQDRKRRIAEKEKGLNARRPCAQTTNGRGMKGRKKENRDKQDLSRF